MGIRIVRLGSPRAAGEGLRLGTVRRPPRGVPKQEFARADFYDVWLPELAPSEPLVRAARSATTEREWQTVRRRYLRELSKPPASRILDLVVHLSHTTHLSVGCYCESEARCHRSILREVLEQRGAMLAGQ
ncbi:MAG TPA: DUF488 family protein [Gemmatimonadales bacterium]|nr:DUF488 family protein [Gemmatimonadales bacterium]